MHVTSGYVRNSASCPHTPRLLMDDEQRRMRSRVIIRFLSLSHASLLFLLSKSTVYLIYTFIWFSRKLISYVAPFYVDSTRIRNDSEAALQASPCNAMTGSEGRCLLFVLKILLQLQITSHQYSIQIHYSLTCCMFRISSLGNFLSTLEAQLHIFLDFSLLLTFDLTFSPPSFHLSSPSHLHQHFCLLMNIWMRLKHWNMLTHTHTCSFSST